MVVMLPTNRLFGPGTTPRPLRYGDSIKAIMGGPSIDLHRLGDRWAIDVVTARMAEEPDGRIWSSALVQSIGSDVRMPWPQFGFDPGSPTGFVIDSAGQQGSSLVLRGGTPGYFARNGQFFNLIRDGRRYLKMLTQDATATGGGAVTLHFWPMLRVIPADGDAIDLATPMIDGVLRGQESGWTLQRARREGLKFSVEERD